MDNTKDLGIIFDASLNFTTHINGIVAKARQRTFLLYRAFISRDKKILLLAFKTYVLPLLSYCSPVWSPCLISNIEALEAVQRLFTKRLPGFKHLSYGTRLKLLKLPSLELRRLRADLLMCFKILHGFASGPPDKYGLIIKNRVGRGHDMKLYKEHDRIDVRKHYFSSRVCGPWNSLSMALVHSTTPDCFKNSLLKHDLSKFMKQDFDCVD